MIDLPEELLIKKIETNSLYCDEKSLEHPTGHTKTKYKLAGPVILEQYIFDVLTTQRSACKNRSTIKIEATHWKDRSSKFTSLKTSYCDITKVEVMTLQEVIEKLKDIDNGFYYCAKLCFEKCHELQALKNRIREIPHISDSAKNIIECSNRISISKLTSKLGLD